MHISAELLGRLKWHAAFLVSAAAIAVLSFLLPTGRPTSMETSMDRQPTNEIAETPAASEAAKVYMPERPAAKAPMQAAAASAAQHKPGYKLATTTVFWVGEDATSDNDYIHNRASAWDENWMEHFGGYDDPLDRCGYLPCDFTPKQNPFYFALPYTDFDGRGGYKDNVTLIPWHDGSIPERSHGVSLIENRWIEVRLGARTCYAQWKDVGPHQTDDIAYVFGDAFRPKNTWGLGSGLDLSPAMRDCLGFDGAAFTAWRFIDEELVPPGPWQEFADLI